MGLFTSSGKSPVWKPEGANDEPGMFVGVRHILRGDDSASGGFTTWTCADETRLLREEQMLESIEELMETEEEEPEPEEPVEGLADPWHLGK